MPRYEVVDWIKLAGMWEDRWAEVMDNQIITRTELQQQFIELQNENELMPDRAITSNQIVVLCFRGTLEPIYHGDQKRPSKFLVHNLNAAPALDQPTLNEQDLRNIADAVMHTIKEALS